jgi:hypothetical protein
MTSIRHSALVLVVVVWISIFIPGLRAQTSTSEPPVRRSDVGWQWVEQFGGSANSDGQVMALTSTGGWNFNSHVGLFAGMPVYFVHNSSSTTGTSSVNGIGDFFGGLRFSLANPILNYRMALTGAAPTGDTSKGLSTGHATYDWTNHFDRRFGPWTPFADLGLANSIPNTLFFQRQFTSLGHLTHFEAGTAYRIFGPLSATASFYDIAPWGSQQVFSQLVAKGGPPAGSGSHGRAFELNQQTTGGADLTRDNGFNFGVDARMSPFDVWVGFTHSVHFDLNVVSFGIGVNMRNLIHRPGGT